MKNKLYLLTLALCLVVLSTVGNAAALGPTDHTEVSNKALTDSRLSNSAIANTIRNNKDCFNLGYMITDIYIL